MLQAMSGARSTPLVNFGQRWLLILLAALMLSQSVVSVLPAIVPPRAAPAAPPLALPASQSAATDAAVPAAQSTSITGPATGGAALAVPNLLSYPELVDRREEFARHYDLGDGQYVAVVSLAPLNYQDRLGKWQPIQPAWDAYATGFQVARNSLRSTLLLKSSGLQLQSAGVSLVWQPVSLAAADASGAFTPLASPRFESAAPAGRLQKDGLTVRYEQGWSDPGLSEEFHSRPGAVEQSLILDRAPRATQGAQWLTFRATLSLPKGVQFFADGRAQTGSFTTEGDLQLTAADGTPVLTLLRPSAYEQGRPENVVAGRYQVKITQQGAELAVQTPWSWWADPARQYPAVLDPTMQVLHDSEHAYVGNTATDTGGPSTGYSTSKMIVVGDTVQHDPSDQYTYYRSYVRFPLPSLPKGAIQPTKAYLVAVPQASIWERRDDPTYQWYDDNISRQPVHVLQMTSDDWLTKLWDPANPPAPASFPGGMGIPWIGQLAMMRQVSQNKGLTKNVPATIWDITSMAQDWYQTPSSNYGLGLALHYEGWYDLEDELNPVAPFTYSTYPARHTIPVAPTWANLDDVVKNLGNPSKATADGFGIAMLVTYADPALPVQTLTFAQVPSAIPTQNYLYQYHEYKLPAATANRWRIYAAEGRYAPDGHPNTPLDLADSTGKVLIKSDGGSAAPYNAAFQWQPNYIAVNGDQDSLALRVQPDNQPTPTHNEKSYWLQITDALPSPAINTGTQASIVLSMTRNLVHGQELLLAENTTVEVKLPYTSTSPGLTKDSAAQFDLQVFAPAKKYASRTVKGSSLTRGPDGYEIEFSIPAGYGGRWLLVVNSNQEVQSLRVTALVMACQNDDNTVRYPMDGHCIELRRPVAGFTSDPSKYKELGSGATRLRLYSPGGFTQLGAAWTTRTQDPSNPAVAVMPLLGYGDDDLRWVALKGGTYTLNTQSNTIATSADSRLVLADFTQPPAAITSLPVLRGQFQAGLATPGILGTTSAAADTYVLVNSPMHVQDDNGTDGTKNGWQYRIDMSSDRMVASGPVLRSTAPTFNQAGTDDFHFNATWSIMAAGGPTLKGTTALTSLVVPAGNPANTFNVGTLIAQAPTAAGSYVPEYAAGDADANQPSCIPHFQQVRIAGTILSEPPSTGGAALPVAALLLPPGISVKDETGANPAVACGAACFDLRGPNDQMTAAGPTVDRQYHMPDLIVQDKANTIAISGDGHLEVYSTDHPRADPAGVDQTSFSYEAFGANVQTYKGVCPQARDAANPGKVVGPAGAETTVVMGEAGMSMPNAGAGADASGMPQIKISFTLCAGSLRDMEFTFDTGDFAAIPIGSSGLWLNHIDGLISLTPQTPGQAAYTTVVLGFGFRGMTPTAASAQFVLFGQVTIDSRGMFDVQLQAAVQLASVTGVAADGHFWVAWSPLDLGFEVDACLPKTAGHLPSTTPTLCAGNELLYGMLKMHTWQGQGWQHRYPWLPDNSAVHATARFEAKITIGRGLVIDWAFLVIPPVDFPIADIKLAFGEFCVNDSCTTYEWGVLGAVGICGYDVGIYYGFDTGLHFFTGSGDYTLIDEHGQQGGSGPEPVMQEDAGSGGITSTEAKALTLTAGLPSALFALGWTQTASPPSLSLQDPDGMIIRIGQLPYAGILITSKVTTTLIAVQNPKPGAWHVAINNVSRGLAYNFAYFANNPPPVVTFAALPTQAVNVPYIPISWTSTIGSTNARLSLYYEEVTKPLTITQDVVGPIVTNLPLTSAGSYNWNLAPLASGAYKVFARIDTPASVAVHRCADTAYNPNPTANIGCGTMLDKNFRLPVERIDVPGSIRYVDSVPPAAPTGVRVRPEGISNLMVSWLASKKPNNRPEQDLAGYIVTCSQPASALTRQVRVAATVQSGKTYSETARVNGLNNEPATCLVQAYDATGNLGSASGQANATPGTNFVLPGSAGNLHYTKTGVHNVQLSWDAPAGSVQGYLLYYYPVVVTSTLTVAAGTAYNGFALLPSGPASGGEADQGASPIDVGNVTGFTLSGLADGTGYQAWVVPYDADGRLGSQSPVLTFDMPANYPINLPLIEEP